MQCNGNPMHVGNVLGRHAREAKPVGSGVWLRIPRSTVQEHEQKAKHNKKLTTLFKHIPSYRNFLYKSTLNLPQ